MITLVSFLLAVIGLFLIALTQKRPRTSLVKSASIKRAQIETYRILASMLLTISFLLVIAYEGWSFGVIVWGTLISVAGISVSFFIALVGSILQGTV